MLKCIASSLFIVGGVSALSGVALEGYTFQKYIKDFEKDYTEAEMGMREEAFEADLENVLQHNAVDHAWKMGINKFSDMNFKEKSMYKGKRSMVGDDAKTMFGEEKPLPDGFMNKLVPVSDLPASVDWRQKGAVTPVKNQGGCGSCWAFSAAEVLESHVAIQTGKLLNLSPQQYVSCAPNPDECGGSGGCAGSTQWLAFNYTLAAGGLSLESDYPYTESTGICNPNKIKPAVGLKGYVRLPANNYTALMNAIATLGPVAISVAADEFMSYESGIFNTDCGWTIDHAVVLVGYGPGYYLVRNSWGSSWGEDGYIRIDRTDKDATRCGDDTDVADGTACKPYPSKVKVCGLCGILSDSSYPTGAYIV